MMPLAMGAIATKPVISGSMNLIASDWLELESGMIATGSSIAGAARGRSRLYLEAGAIGWIKGQGDLPIILDIDSTNLVYFYQAKYSLKRNNSGDFIVLESHIDNDGQTSGAGVPRETPRRIRFDSTAIYFEYSLDGEASWITFRSEIRYAGALYFKTANSDDVLGSNDMHLNNINYLGFKKL